MMLPAHSEPWWLITRVTGVAAAVAVGVAVVLGVALARRRSTPRTRARLVWHRRVTWAALGLIAGHILAALLDRHHVPLYALVAPFMSPVRRVAAGTGVLAVWGLVLIAITAAGRRRLKRAWRKIHYLAYPVSVLAVVHSLMGTDGRLVLIGAVLSLGPVVVWWRRTPRTSPVRATDLVMSSAPPLATATPSTVSARRGRSLDRVDA